AQRTLHPVFIDVQAGAHGDGATGVHHRRDRQALAGLPGLEDSFQMIKPQDLSPSTGSRNTSMRPLHPSPSPQTMSSSAVMSKCKSRGWPERSTSRAASRTSPSRQPPLMVP